MLKNFAGLQKLGCGTSEQAAPALGWQALCQPRELDGSLGK